MRTGLLSILISIPLFFYSNSGLAEDKLRAEVSVGYMDAIQIASSKLEAEERRAVVGGRAGLLEGNILKLADKGAHYSDMHDDKFYWKISFDFSSTSKHNASSIAVFVDGETGDILYK